MPLYPVGVHELSFPSPRLQMPFSTIPRSFINCHSFQSPFLYKSHPFFQFRGFPSDSSKKNQSFLFKGRAAIAGLQENSKEAEEKSTPEEAIELEEFAEEWRRKKIGWLCKELPTHEPAPMIRLLNKQRKWIKQEDVHYIINHLLRLRENSISHRVYEWMIKQDWYEFDLGLATKLADFLGKDMKVKRCRDVFDAIINRDHIPCESTFTILTMAYIEATDKGSVDKAINIYNQMIQLGGYQPSPSLRKSLFKALLHGTGGAAKHYLKQAELIFQNMEAAGYKINKEMYEGLIWLHSYQDYIDHERIQFLRNNMKQSGIKESEDILVSILRVCSKCIDVEEAERTWAKLLDTRCKLTSHPFVYRMEVYAKAGQVMKSTEIFKEMQEKGVPASVIAYKKIIQLLTKAQQKEYAEIYMKQFEDSGLKPLQSSYVELMQMYMSLQMYNKVESTFSRCITKCRPKWIAHDLYLESLIKCGELEKAEEVFTGLQKDSAMNVKGKTCNIMLESYVNAGQEAKIRKLYDQMCHKKYNIDPSLMERIKHFISPVNKDIYRYLSLTLNADQREIVTAILLSGARLESHDKSKTFELHFECSKNLEFCDVLKTNLYDIFFEWLKPQDQLYVQVEEMSWHFSTVNHRSFRFFAYHFRPGGKMAVPRLIHYWLSPRTLAYWYMYGGRKSTSGAIVFYGISDRFEESENIVKALKAKSINCVIKRQRMLFQIRCQGKDAMCLWKLMEPYILDGLKEVLKPEDRYAEVGAGTEGVDFGSEDAYNKESSSSKSETEVHKGIEETEIESKIYTQEVERELAFLAGEVSNQCIPKLRR